MALPRPLRGHEQSVPLVAPTEVAAPSAKPSAIRSAWRRIQWALPLISVVVFLAIWQIVGGRLNPILLSTPSGVGKAFVKISKEGILLPAFLHAMEVLGTGVGLAAVAGIIVGVIMGRSRTVYRVMSPYVAFFQATPLVAVVPLIVIWFGIGFTSEVAVTFMLAIWSIIINTTEGVQNTPYTLLDMARIYHASEGAVIRHIAVPNALPYIFAGLRIGLAKGLIGVIIAEMDVSLKGLGGLAENFGGSFQTAPLLATIITSSLVGVIGTIVLETLRRRLAPWAKNDDAARKV